MMARKKISIIGVAGGSGSGKTTVAQNLFQLVGTENCVLIPHDNYYRNQDSKAMSERVKTNYDHPDALETELLVKHLKQLRSGKTVKIPTYDFVHHTRAAASITVTPKPIIILDGILLFTDPELRALCDFKVFVDTDADVRFARRLRRDVAERGRTYEFGIEQYLAFTRPMHQEFVEPSKRFADIILPEGGFNEQALAMIYAHTRELIAQSQQ